MAIVNLDFCKKYYGLSSVNEIKTAFLTEEYKWQTFSPDFCPIKYACNNSEVHEKNLPPVGHFLRLKESEKNSFKIEPIKNYNNEIYLSTDKKKSIKHKKIVLHLHIYYQPYITYIFQILSKRKIDFDVIITTTDSLSSKVKEKFNKKSFGKNVKIFNVENRGRNFLPLFVSIRDEILKYDVIFHIHSKMSLYSGNPKLLWGDYLISSLVGQDKIMDNHISLINEGRYDCIAPVPFPSLPGWASHTLKNDRYLQEYSNNNDALKVRSWIAYPIGGMFCMSKKLFRKILDLDIRKEKFPHEPSGPDGEYHHFLERAIGLISGSGLIFHNTVKLNYVLPEDVLKEEFSRATKSNFYGLVKNLKTVSFDFFDTLVFRQFPSENYAKEVIGNLFKFEYQKIRDLAELKIRTKLKRDVGLLDIASEMQQYAKSLNGKTPQFLTDLEKKVEISCLQPRQSALDMLNYCFENKKEVVIVSDSFYDEIFIKEVFQKCFPELIKQLTSVKFYISSEIGLRKDTGTIWDFIHGHLPQKSMLHVGDNVVSDLQIPSEFIHTHYVSNAKDEIEVASGFSEELKKLMRYNCNMARVIS